MIIEKLSDTQIRVLCTAEEMKLKGLKVSDVTYGSEAAGKLVRSALLAASVDYAFTTQDSNLMVEITPLPGDEIEFLISKVDFPEEFDTRYSEFLPSAPEGDHEEGTFEDFREVTDQDEKVSKELSGANDKDADRKEQQDSNPEDDDADDLLGMADPEDEAEGTAEGPDMSAFPADFREMMKALQSGDLPPGITFAPIDPSMLGNLGIDPNNLQGIQGIPFGNLKDGQFIGGTIIDARTSDGRPLSNEEVSGLLRGLLSSLEPQPRENAPDEDEDLALAESEAAGAAGDTSVSSSNANTVAGVNRANAKTASGNIGSGQMASEDGTAVDNEFAPDTASSDPAESDNASSSTASSDLTESGENTSDSTPSEPEQKLPEKEYNHKTRLVRMFGFDTLADCIQACASIAPIYHGESILFRAPKNADKKTPSRFGEYILCITNDHCSNREFSLAYNQLFEYNGKRISPKVAFDHIEEHYDTMIAADAIHILKDL
ncbi:MAG: adaptor protein MecA [Lachnospiraceae bacterium]|nr:adaptor protein MecA [Lachnospiraceae bacterium]